MARRRMIDPNIWQSEDFAKLSTLAKLVFIGMFSNADDEGRGRAKSVYLKSILFPYEEGMRIIDIEKALSEIGQNVSVTLYSHDGNEYYSLDNWSKWQKVEKPSPSKITAPIAINEIPLPLTDHSSNAPRILDDESSLKEKKGIELKVNTIPPFIPLQGEVPALERKKPSTLTKAQEALFTRFWNVYPRLESMGDAEKAWKKLNADEALTQEIIDAVERSKKYDHRFREKQYTPHPSTWLNGKEWKNKYDSKEIRQNGTANKQYDGAGFREKI